MKFRLSWFECKCHLQASELSAVPRGRGDFKRWGLAGAVGYWDVPASSSSSFLFWFPGALTWAAWHACFPGCSEANGYGWARTCFALVLYVLVTVMESPAPTVCYFSFLPRSERTSLTCLLLLLCRHSGCWWWWGMPYSRVWDRLFSGEGAGTVLFYRVLPQPPLSCPSWQAASSAVSSRLLSGTLCSPITSGLITVLLVDCSSLVFPVCGGQWCSVLAMLQSSQGFSKRKRCQTRRLTGVARQERKARSGALSKRRSRLLWKRGAAAWMLESSSWTPFPLHSSVSSFQLLPPLMFCPSSCFPSCSLCLMMSLPHCRAAKSSSLVSESTVSGFSPLTGCPF